MRHNDSFVGSFAAVLVVVFALCHGCDTARADETFDCGWAVCGQAADDPWGTWEIVPKADEEPWYSWEIVRPAPPKPAPKPTAQTVVRDHRGYVIETSRCVSGRCR